MEPVLHPPIRRPSVLRWSGDVLYVGTRDGRHFAVSPESGAKRLRRAADPTRDASVLTRVSDAPEPGQVQLDGRIARFWCNGTLREQSAEDFTCAALSPDGQCAASAGDSGAIWLHDLAQGTHTVLGSHGKAALGVAFSPDGANITGAVLAGSIDTRPLVDLVEPGGAEDAVCNLVSTFGIACEPCAGGGDFCLTLLVDSMAAAEVPGLTVIPVSEADIAADPNCQ